MKTKEELNALKEAVEALNKKLAELNDEELTQGTGGNTCLFGGHGDFVCPKCGCEFDGYGELMEHEAVFEG